MTNPEDELFEKHYRAGAIEPDSDRLVRVLAEFSGCPPSEHEKDAFHLKLASIIHIDNTKTQIERTKQIHKAACQIERAVSAIPKYDCSGLVIEHEDCSDPSTPFLGPPSLSSQSYADFILLVMQTLKQTAKISEREAVGLSELFPPKSKNMKTANIQIAGVVADIYFRVKKREPPKDGATGPFQRLLLGVYQALGRENVDLRGPLRAVHEYRKNRLS